MKTPLEVPMTNDQAPKKLQNFKASKAALPPRSNISETSKAALPPSSKALPPAPEATVDEIADRMADKGAREGGAGR